MVNVGAGKNYFQQRLSYFKVSIQDKGDNSMLEFFEGATEFMRKQLLAKQSVLVHCSGCIHRSPVIAIAYLMKYNEMPLLDAIQFVKNLRKPIQIRENYMQDLKIWESMLSTRKK